MGLARRDGARSLLLLQYASELRALMDGAGPEITLVENLGILTASLQTNDVLGPFTYTCIFE